jgi:hypothetical protein
MRTWVLLVFVTCTTALYASDTPQLVNAHVEDRSAAGGLEQAIAALPAQATPVWVAYSEPVIAGEHTMCCFGSYEGWKRNPNCCGGCRLEQEGSYFSGKTSNCEPLEPSGVFLVFLRVANRQVEKVRTYSTNCALDAGDKTVYWLSDVKPTDSVAYLRKLAENPGGGHVADGALAALAQHADPSADQALEALIAPGHPDHVVEQATFWLGNARGSRGYEIIAAALERNQDFGFRKHAVFALSQNSDARAQKKLIDMARHDASSDVRSEALFWLAQEAGAKVAGVITDAIANDPETEVKKKAVFALSQFPDDQGVPLLIEQAKTNRNPEVRKDAIFWLGQSGDPRALEFIASVLEK